MGENSGLAQRPTPRLIVFDLDGTLIDSLPDLTVALGLALADFGLPPAPPAVVRAMLGEGQRVLVQRALLTAGGELGQLDEVLGRYRHHYDEHLYDATVCYPGVTETLRHLPATTVMAVATNKPGKWARRLTAHLGLDARLRWVLGEDDVGARKPDPKMLLDLCGRAQVAPDQALMVGDSRVDLEAAEAAGMQVALCAYGYCDPETLHAARHAKPAPETPLGSRACPYLLETFADLLARVSDG